jgi:hypothetical protein
VLVEQSRSGTEETDPFSLVCSQYSSVILRARNILIGTATNRKADEDERRQPRKQTEPPKLATEINRRRRCYRAPTPPSPVRNQNPASAKTQRNRALFRKRQRTVASSLCSSHLSGGGGSLERTRLCRLIPVKQGKYREFLSVNREIQAIWIGPQSPVIEQPRFLTSHSNLDRRTKNENRQSRGFVDGLGNFSQKRKCP